jgi:hypothetical protein
MSAPQINFEKFDFAKLSMSSFNKKQIDQQGAAPIVYMESSDKYDYGNTVDDVFIEGPELFNSGGINEQKNEKFNKKTYQINSKLGTRGKEPQFKQFLENLKLVHGQLVIPSKVMVGLQEIPDEMVPRMIKDMYTKPKDRATQAIIEGMAPSIYFQLFRQGYGIMEQKTTFTGLDGKIIDWSLLRGVEFKYIPLFHVKGMFMGAAAKKITFELKSAVVYDIKARANVIRQTDTISSILLSNPNALKEYEEQLKKLKADQDEIIKSSGSNNNNSNLADSLIPKTFAVAGAPNLQVPNNSPVSGLSPVGQMTSQFQQQNMQQFPQQGMQQQNSQGQQAPQQMQPQQQVPQMQQFQPQQQMQQNQFQPQQQVPQAQPQMQQFPQTMQQIPQMQPQSSASPSLSDFMKNLPSVQPTTGLTPVPNGNTFNPLSMPQFTMMQQPGTVNLQ